MKKAGQSTVTRTPLSPTSAASVSLNAITPALVTLYAPIIGAQAKPAIEAVLRIAPPPCATRRGAKKWQPWMTPMRLMPMIHRQSSSGACPIVPAAATPALFTTRSMRPRR